MKKHEHNSSAKTDDDSVRQRNGKDDDHLRDSSGIEESRRKMRSH